MLLGQMDLGDADVDMLAIQLTAALDAPLLLYLSASDLAAGPQVAKRIARSWQYLVERIWPPWPASLRLEQPPCVLASTGNRVVLGSTQGGESGAQQIVQTQGWQSRSAGSIGRCSVPRGCWTAAQGGRARSAASTACQRMTTPHPWTESARARLQDLLRHGGSTR
jgi:hypothetical protein